MRRCPSRAAEPARAVTGTALAVTTFEEAEMEIKRAAVKRADRTITVADRSKFASRALAGMRERVHRLTLV